MDGTEPRPRLARYRQFIWVPRGPAGMLLFVVLLALLLALVVVAAAVALVVAVGAGLVLAAFQATRLALGRGREPVVLPPVNGRFVAGGRGEPPLERYLTCVDEFDRVTTQVLQVDLERSGSWLASRRLRRLYARAGGLREAMIEVERHVSADHAAEVARPGLWELIVAATELQHYLHDLLAFPASRGRAAQLRELVALQERRQEVGQRRDSLVRRLQGTDLRPHAREA